MLLLSVQRNEPTHPGRLQGPGRPLQEGLETEKTSAFDQEEEATEADDDDDGPVVAQARECRCWAHARRIWSGGDD